VALKGSGDLEGAVHHLEEAIRLNPNYAEAYNNLGLALKDQGKLADAAAKFRRALSVSPGQTAARLNLDDVEAQIKRARQ
jgi:superkiller protein 3